MTEHVVASSCNRQTSDGRAEAGKRLIKRTETYASMTGLVRLLLLRWKSGDGSGRSMMQKRLDALVDELGAFRERLVALLDRWSSKTAEGFGTKDGEASETMTAAPPFPPGDYYQLYLLMDALAEVVRSSS